jgi:phosphohistidine phosphatase
MSMTWLFGGRWAGRSPGFDPRRSRAAGDQPGVDDPLALGDVVADGGGVGRVEPRPLPDDDARFGRRAVLFVPARRVELEPLVAEARLRVPYGFAAVALRVDLARRVDGLRAVEDALRVAAFGEAEAFLVVAALRVDAVLRPVEVFPPGVDVFRAVVDVFRAVVDALRPVVDAFRRVDDVFRPADALRVVDALRRRVPVVLAAFARLVVDAPPDRLALDPDDAAVLRVFDPLDFAAPDLRLVRRVDRFLPRSPGNASTSGCTNSLLLRRSPARTADAAPSCAVRLATCASAREMALLTRTPAIFKPDERFFFVAVFFAILGSPVLIPDAWPGSMGVARAHVERILSMVHHAPVRKTRFEIYLLRHADAGDPDAWEGDDAERPLSAKGTRQAERLARFLSASGFKPDRIISSPKLRASQTASIVGTAVGVAVATDERLAEGFDLSRVSAMIGAADSSRTVLVGHDPDFSDLLAELTGSKALPLPKGALARVDFEDKPRRGAGTLRWLIPPDALKPSA